PGRAPARTSSLASSIDLGPTLLELCGLGGYDGIQGRSLVPLLDDPAATVRDHVLIEDDVAPITARLAGFPAKTRTLVTENWRYTRNSTREEQLFDLRADPDERNDLRRDRPELRAEATARMMDALIDADDAARGAPHAEPVPTGW
ncbi:MAG: sulfatase, partial [Acidimicrobiia bacterium]|nr:sulfatase [Acidimicrobiia bacterium]